MLQFSKSFKNRNLMHLSYLSQSLLAFMDQVFWPIDKVSVNLTHEVSVKRRNLLYNEHNT